MQRMFVSAAHRRRGIASVLLATATAHAQRISLEELNLNTSEFQPAAVELYRSHGFEQTGTGVMYLGVLLPMKMLYFHRKVVV
jgi:ribosomal protein S18 acetylase RimI-like enzyme